MSKFRAHLNLALKSGKNPAGLPSDVWRLIPGWQKAKIRKLHAELLEMSGAWWKEKEMVADNHTFVRPLLTRRFTRTGTDYERKLARLLRRHNLDVRAIANENYAKSLGATGDFPASARTEMLSRMEGEQSAVWMSETWDEGMSNALTKAEQENPNLAGKALVAAILLALFLWWKTETERQARVASISETTTPYGRQIQRLAGDNAHLNQYAMVYITPDSSTQHPRDTEPLCQAVIDGMPYSISQMNGIGWPPYHRLCPHTGEVRYENLPPGSRGIVDGKTT